MPKYETKGTQKLKIRMSKYEMRNKYEMQNLNVPKQLFRLLEDGAEDEHEFGDFLDELVAFSV